MTVRTCPISSVASEPADQQTALSDNRAGVPRLPDVGISHSDSFQNAPRLIPSHGARKLSDEVSVEPVEAF